MNESGTVPSRRKWLWGAGAAATALGMGTALWRYTPQNVPASAGHPVWAEQFETPAGQVLRMAEFQGKPLLLNFWATWCPPCVEELPMLNAFWKENARQGHQVVRWRLTSPARCAGSSTDNPWAFPSAWQVWPVLSWVNHWAMWRAACHLRCFSRQMAAFGDKRWVNCSMKICARGLARPLEGLDSLTRGVLTSWLP